ncbi:MAG: J domain-containing protein [Elusimicrobiota bacterium]
MEKDWYVVLGVPRGAPDAEIKLAYRELALIHHPDRNPGGASAKKFMLIKEAYKVLSDPHERLLYDKELKLRAGKAWRPPAPAAAAPPPPEAPRKPGRRGLSDHQVLSRMFMAAGAMLAGRGFLGAYVAPQSVLLGRWLSLNGGQTEGFLMLLGGVALLIFGFGR